jgi:hypothetical protein
MSGPGTRNGNFGIPFYLSPIVENSPFVAADSETLSNDERMNSRFKRWTEKAGNVEFRYHKLEGDLVIGDVAGMAASLRVGESCV